MILYQAACLLSACTCSPVLLSLQKTNEHINTWLTWVPMGKLSVGVFTYKPHPSWDSHLLSSELSVISSLWKSTELSKWNALFDGVSPCAMNKQFKMTHFKLRYSKD